MSDGSGDQKMDGEEDWQVTHKCYAQPSSGSVEAEVGIQVNKLF